MKKVSIIIPIYNEEKNIRKCVESILKGTYKELEIILLNDGSKDQTREILDSFTDKRVKVIHKENTGISDTRNQGLALATGEYIMFVDSDDYIEPDCVAKFVTELEKSKADIVISNYYLETANKTYNIDLPELGVTSIIEDPDLLSKINLSPWNKIYKKEIIKGNKFPLKVKYEDAPFVVNAICKAKKISFISDHLYHYVMQKSGETITRDERLFDIITICTMINKTLENYPNIEKTNLNVKILSPYLKHSRYIKNKELQKEFINAIYIYLNKIDSHWRKCSYLKNETTIKRMIITHKSLLNIANKIR